jgi:hypothetical protein
MNYVVRAHSTGRLTTAPTTVNSPGSFIAVSLDVRGYEIFCAYPLSTFESETRGKVFVANLGLIQKMAGPAAIVTNALSLQHNGRVLVDTRVKALGVLGKKSFSITTYCFPPRLP